MRMSPLLEIASTVGGEGCRCDVGRRAFVDSEKASIEVARGVVK